MNNIINLNNIFKLLMKYITILIFINIATTVLSLKNNLRKYIDINHEDTKYSNKDSFHIINEYIGFFSNNNSLIVEGSITYNNHCNSLKLYNTLNPNIDNTEVIIAKAHYNRSLPLIGWSKLYIETLPYVEDNITSYSAGYLEGVLTCHQILNFYNNLYNIHIEDEKYLKRILSFYSKVENSLQKKITREYISSLSTQDEKEYWNKVIMIHSQTIGLMDGYNSIMKNNKLNIAQFYFINADGEIPELISVYKYKEKQSYYRFKDSIEKFSKEYLQLYFDSDNPEKIWTHLMQKSHCSALLKKINSDIMIGHTTWDSFAEMNRIIKQYNFTYNNGRLLLSFSSYAGTLTSTDDFYILNEHMVILETSLETLDKSLFDKISKEDNYIPNYIRISVSNYLSNTPDRWCKVFKNYNSGTYSSQWMIYDYSTSSFFILEQIPGYLVYDNMTSLFNQKGFWMSFNRPYFNTISHRSGYEEMYRRYGRTYSYEYNPRARIFNSLIPSINDIEQMKKILRYNLSEDKRDYINTISPRYDLAINPEYRRLSGGIDSKITNRNMVHKGGLIAISGPSSDNNASIFDWSHHIGEAHDGLLLKWDFKWESFNKYNIKD